MLAVMHILVQTSIVTVTLVDGHTPFGIRVNWGVILLVTGLAEESQKELEGD